MVNAIESAKKALDTRVLIRRSNATSRATSSKAKPTKNECLFIVVNFSDGDCFIEAFGRFLRFYTVERFDSRRRCRNATEVALRDQIVGKRSNRRWCHDVLLRFRPKSKRSLCFGSNRRWCHDVLLRARLAPSDSTMLPKSVSRRRNSVLHALASEAGVNDAMVALSYVRPLMDGVSR